MEASGKNRPIRKKQIFIELDLQMWRDAVEICRPLVVDWRRPSCQSRWHHRAAHPLEGSARPSPRECLLRGEPARLMIAIQAKWVG